jgi:hypothetical protein
LNDFTIRFEERIFRRNKAYHAKKNLIKYIMDGFNLNSDAYNHDELEELFGLTKPYSEEDISNAKGILSQQLTSSNDLGPERKREILFFIDTIADRVSNTAPHQKPHDDGAGTWAERQVPIAQYGSNVIIKNPNEIVGKHARLTEGRLATDGTAPPGYINPINIRTTMQAVNIDSRFRPNYYKTTSTKYSMKLPTIQKRVVKMTVGSLEIPMTYHAIAHTLGNNMCLIFENTDPTNTTPNAWLLTLPDGNYEQSWASKSEAMDIEIAMNNAIATADPGTVDINTGVFDATGGPKLDPTKDICYRLDRASGRSTFATPSPDGEKTTYTIRFNIATGDEVSAGSLAMDINIQFRLGWPLGFRAAEYVTGGAAVSEGICFVTGPRYGFLSIDDHQKNYGNSFLVAYSNSVFDRNIISRINLAAIMDDTGTYKSSNDPGLTTAMNRSREYFGPVDIQNLNITLYDEYGRVINLNNMDWSFTLAFEKLYD